MLKITLLKQKQKLADLEVVEKKPSPLKKTSKPSAQKMRRTPFGMKPEKDRSKNKDIIKDTISRPDKRYDKVKKVKTEYIKTEASSRKPFKKRKFK